MADGVIESAEALIAPHGELAFLAQIDWQRPWLAAVLPVAQEVLQMLGDVRSASAMRQALSDAARKRALCNQAGLALEFVAQACLPEGCAYESFIFAQGQVPTRDNLHDFFNALVWLGMPQIKRELNRLQAAQISQHGVGQVRGALRDAATLFDENAALLLLADDASGYALAEALRAHDWAHFFAQLPASGRAYLFGHALMEKLVHPYKAITAHTWLLHGPTALLHAPLHEQLAYCDTQIAQQLQHAAPIPANFLPLPIAGIPGWWAGQDAQFYADVHVFRPPRKPKVRF